jgi:hypothetical protein
MFAAASHAETIGPPVADVKRGTIGAGLDYSTIDFKMKRDEGFNPTFDYDVTDMKATSLKAAYGLMDGISLSLRAGSLGDGETDGANSSGAHRIRGTDASGDLWGVGLDAIVWKSGAFSVGLMGRYTEFSWDTHETRNANSGRDSVNVTALEAALGVGYTFMGSLTPYGGILLQKLSGNTRFVRDDGSNRSDSPLEGRQSSFGYVGVRYQSPWKVNLGIEMLTNSTWSANVGVQF